MNPEHWAVVDRYFESLVVGDDPVLAAALADSAAAGLPAINVSPNQGKFLQVLAVLVGAKNILEIGTLGGYSTIWLARALAAGGRLVTLEALERHARIALANIARAGLSDVVELRLGPALETLPKLADEKRGPFDLIFIDADKPPTADYFNWAVKLSRPGSLIIVDNVMRKGAIVSANSAEPEIVGMRRCVATMAADKRVTVAAVQTVGSKGYDGFAIAVVKGN
jgi:predicted O-methyltransferase YrrM